MLVKIPYTPRPLQAELHKELDKQFFEHNRGSSPEPAAQTAKNVNILRTTSFRAHSMPWPMRK